MTDFSNNTAGRTQLLISLVKEYPALYDPAHVDYRDTKVTRPKIWAEITNKVEEQYPPLPNETPCPERWRSLRDRFTAVKRTMLRNRRSEFKMTTPSWPYWENMQWYSRYCPKLTRRKASFTIKRSPSSPVMDDSLPPLSLSPTSSAQLSCLPSPATLASPSQPTQHSDNISSSVPPMDFSTQDQSIPKSEGVVQSLSLIADVVKCVSKPREIEDEHYHFAMQLPPIFRQLSQLDSIRLKSRIMSLVSETIESQPALPEKPKDLYTG